MPEIIEPIRFINEEWKPVEIEGVKPMYEVSTEGRVRNINTGKYIKPCIINTGYRDIRLFSGDSSYYKTGDYSGRYKHVLLHRLVMTTFNPIDNADEMTVDHINTDKSNNSVSNLEWVTQAENNRLGINYYKDHKSCDYYAKFSIEDLRVIHDELEKGTMYKDILEKIGKENNNKNKNTLCNIKRGKAYKAVMDILDIEDRG